MPEQSRERSTGTGAESRTSPSTSSATSTSSASWGHDVDDTRPQRYLAAPGDGDARRLRAELDRQPGIRLLRWIESAGQFPPLAVFTGAPADAAALFERTGALIEPDQRLRHGAPCGSTMSDPTAPDAIGVMHSARVDVTIEVCDSAGRPVADAAVYVIDHDCPATAITNPDGHAVLNLPAQVCDTASALVVRPARGHWSVQIPRPALTPDAPFTVTCARLEPGGHGQPHSQWSRHVLGLDHAVRSGGAPGAGAGSVVGTGVGVRIALIGSGADLDHPELGDANVIGHDLVERDEKSWRTDTAGVGTCAASLLVGSAVPDEEGLAVPGMCREAELHVLKLAPGGRTGELIEALDYCADHGIDVACVCVGQPSPSPLLAAKIRQARDAGVCVIAAAGDQPDAVLQPAALSGVLAVGALGCLGTFPPESSHAVRMTTSAGPEGYFVAGCTPTGPSVDLHAPGVAILGAAPGGGYVPCDGTAVAAARTAGIAGLIAAHHPAVRDRGVRGAARADLVAQLVLATAHAVQTGTGRVQVPNAASAVGVLSGGSSAGFEFERGLHV